MGFDRWGNWHIWSDSSESETYYDLNGRPMKKMKTAAMKAAPMKKPPKSKASNDPEDSGENSDSSVSSYSHCHGISATKKGKVCGMRWDVTFMPGQSIRRQGFCEKHIDQKTGGRKVLHYRAKNATPAIRAEKAKRKEFVIAASEGNLQKVKKILKEHDKPDKVINKRTNGDSALAAAAKNGKHEVVCELLLQGADPRSHMGLQNRAVADITAGMMAEGARGKYTVINQMLTLASDHRAVIASVNKSEAPIPKPVRRKAADLKLPELKELLKTLKLKCTGNKNELVERVPEDALDAEYNTKLQAYDERVQAARQRKQNAQNDPVYLSVVDNIRRVCMGSKATNTSTSVGGPASSSTAKASSPMLAATAPPAKKKRRAAATSPGGGSSSSSDISISSLSGKGASAATSSAKKGAKAGGKGKASSLKTASGTLPVIKQNGSTSSKGATTLSKGPSSSPKIAKGATATSSKTATTQMPQSAKGTTTSSKTASSSSKTATSNNKGATTTSANLGKTTAMKAAPTTSPSTASSKGGTGKATASSKGGTDEKPTPTTVTQGGKKGARSKTAASEPSPQLMKGPFDEGSRTDKTDVGKDTTAKEVLETDTAGQTVLGKKDVAVEAKAE
ncbi:unnamed protein product, partial [Amoebophrya sp. A25]|eukprot:GSA25T00006242001.1